jgi:hypothetical protein
MWDDFCDFCGLVLRVAAVLVVALGLLVVMSRCGEEREVYDPYAWSGGTPEAADATVYEEEMLANSLPPCGD